MDRRDQSRISIKSHPATSSLISIMSIKSRKTLINCCRISSKCESKPNPRLVSSRLKRTAPCTTRTKGQLLRRQHKTIRQPNNRASHRPPIRVKASNRSQGHATARRKARSRSTQPTCSRSRTIRATQSRCTQMQ